MTTQAACNNDEYWFKLLDDGTSAISPFENSLLGFASRFITLTTNIWTTVLIVYKAW